MFDIERQFGTLRIFGIQKDLDFIKTATSFLKWLFL